jgi:fluoride exporter
MMSDLKKPLLWIAMGGACGALLRHITHILFDLFVPISHYFTAISFENVLGSFLMGYFFSRFNRTKAGEEVRQLVLVGIIGSYTTYSGFGVEAMTLLSESPTIFSLYIFSQVFLGLMALVLGLKLGK